MPVTPISKIKIEDGEDGTVTIHDPSIPLFMRLSSRAEAKRLMDALRIFLTQI